MNKKKEIDFLFTCIQKLDPDAKDLDTYIIRCLRSQLEIFKLITEP
jgi:hypothetical protein